MFFSTYVLTKKGPLAKIWLAAHWDRRLTRHEVKVVDLRQSIVHIVEPVVPIALRTSGELLVGVVRIYALKVRHLLKDATDATLLLRVTTWTNKSHPVPTEEGVGLAPASLPPTKTLMDGVLVHGASGDVEAVTFDWCGTHTSRAAATVTALGEREAADALCEARFDDIADLLKSGGVPLPAAAVEKGNPTHAGEMDGEAALFASAWYALEPTSQGVEELHTTQQDYDEIARLRADLLAFGERGGNGGTSTPSESGSKKSMSNPSIEKARSSAQHMMRMHTTHPMGDLNGSGFPQPISDELFDIGVPLPEDHELPAFLMPVGEDPFAVPGMLMQPPGSGSHPNMMNENGSLARHGLAAQRKARAVNVVDAAATTLPREIFERWMADRSDTIDAEPRRGPFDQQEAQDRTFLAHDAEKPTPSLGTGHANQNHTNHPPGSGLMWQMSGVAPLFGVSSVSLRDAYAAALSPSMQTAIHAHKPHKPPQQPNGEDMDEALPAGAGEEELAEAERASAGQKRPRDLDGNEANNENGGVNGLSATAVATLQRIQTEIVRANPALSAKNPKPTRKSKRSRSEEEEDEESPSVSFGKALLEGRCLLRKVCHGMHRREAARAFVDVLALASKQMVSVQQQSVEGDVELGLLASAETVLA